MAKIKFGTDGWRAVIGKEFTPANVCRVAQAVSDYFKKGKMLVGYDTRLRGDRFAGELASVLAANGIKVLLTDEPHSTPAVSFAIAHRSLTGGVMITASHNPANFSGIKIKASYGGPASSELTSGVEKLLDRRPAKRLDFTAACDKGLIELVNLRDSYYKFIKSRLNWKVLKKPKLKIAVDSMYGAGDNYLAEILEETNSRVTTIRGSIDPSFGGTTPEPIAKNLGELCRLMKKRKFDLGIANDGDADRIGVVLPGGKHLNPQYLLPLVLLHFIEDKNLRGAVGKTISGSVLTERICRHYQLKLYETPVGFKHITRLLLEKNILVGGEESGGYGFRGYLKERDGIMAALLLLEMMAERKKTIGEIIRAMEKKFGRLFYDRLDVEYPEKLKKILFKRLLKNPPRRLLGKAVAEIKSYDGVKLIGKDESWILLRLSGTEPILRIYAESESKKRTAALLRLGRRIAFGIGG